MIAFHKGEIPFTLLLLPFLAGMGLDIIYPCQTYILAAWLVFGIILLIFIGLNIGYQKLNLHKARWIGGIMANVLMALAGMLCFEGNRQINSPDHFSKQKPAYLIGHITSEPKLNNGTLRFVTKIEQTGDATNTQKATGNLMLSVKVDTARQLPLYYGDKLIIPAKFTDVEGPMNPAEFNYKAFMAHQNIYQQAYLMQHQVRVLEHDAGNPMIAFALKLRLSMVNKLKAAIRDTDAVAVASTIILGYRADLRKEVQEAYAKTGTMHLLSVAGMHVGLVYFMIAFLLSFLPHRKHTKLIKAIISITLIWGYALVTGFNAPVNRAVLMLTMVIIGFSFNRHINRLNVLAVSAFILLLYNPFYLCDAGFQLSYLAVFGIIIIQPYISKWWHPKTHITRELWLVCSVSIAAQVILFPIGALYFHDFPVYFLVSNVFIVIPSMIVMYGGIIYLLLPHITFISGALGWLLEKTIMIMTKTLTVIEQAPVGSISKIWLNPAELVLAYAMIISTLCFLVLRNKQWLKAGLLIAMLLCISYSLKAYTSSNTKSITFFSLRKNMAILFRDGNSGVLLTDLQPNDKAYQYSIQPCLDSCRITTVQYPGKDINTTGLMKHGNLIQFGNKTVLMINKTFEGKTFPDKLKIDYLYISGAPHIDLSTIWRNYAFKVLMADGSNSTRWMNQFEHDALLAKVNFINLKRNKAVLVVSN